MLSTGLLLFAFLGNDATSAWVMAGKPLTGVHDAGEWVLSCVCEPSDPDGEAFADVELAGCKQEAVVALVDHCVGRLFVPEAIPEDLRPAVTASLSKWLVARVRAEGLTWVQANRTKTTCLVVLAVPNAVCRGMPRGNQWLISLSDVVAASKGWVVPAALLELADSDSRQSVASTLKDRLAELIQPSADRWPSGFVKLPNGLDAASLHKMQLSDLAVIAASRPGDAPLWDCLAKRCEAEKLHRAAAIVRGLPQEMNWPSPSRHRADKPWGDIPAVGLPDPLVAVIRAGGGISAKPCIPEQAGRDAAEAFFAKVPDPVRAESKACEAASVPDSDALNLLAALRLLDPHTSDDSLCHALAFAWQSHVLSPDHPYAKINVLRAMRKLGMREEAADFVKQVPSAQEGTWARRELEAIEHWLRPTPSDKDPAQ